MDNFGLGALASRVQLSPRVRELLHRARPVLIVLAAVYGAVLWYRIVSDPASGWDAHAYWSANLGHLYSSSLAGAPGAYLYSPAFRQAIEPLTLLPWPAFHALWDASLIALVIVLTGPLALFVLATPIVAYDLTAGNIHVLMAAAVVLGFRYPATWSFVLLTKVTPGIGVLWFLVRREWRNLAMALGATVLVVAVSALLGPGLWVQWVQSLVRDAAIPASAYNGLTVPLVLRLVLAAFFVTLGALTSRPWTVALAATLAIPLLAQYNFTMLIALIPLLLPDAVLVIRRWLPSIGSATSRHGANSPAAASRATPLPPR